MLPRFFRATLDSFCSLPAPLRSPRLAVFSPPLPFQYSLVLFGALITAKPLFEVSGDEVRVRTLLSLADSDTLNRAGSQISIQVPVQSWRGIGERTFAEPQGAALI